MPLPMTHPRFLQIGTAVRRVGTQDVTFLYGLDAQGEVWEYIRGGVPSSWAPLPEIKLAEVPV